MDFANGPFDELWDYISTPKYRIDRSSRAIRSFKIYLILKKENLDSNEWYTKIYRSEYNQPWPPTNGRIINFSQSLNWDFLVMMLIGYTQILFSIVESKFRLFQMAIDPNALKGKKCIRVCLHLAITQN